MAENDNSKLDTLSRDEYIQNVQHVIEVLKNNGKGGSFVISAGWGYGKTFVLEKIEKELDANEDFVVLHYDCWKYNYYEEPLVALLASIVDQLKNVNCLAEVLETTANAIGYMLGESLLAVGSAVSKAVLAGVDIVDAGRKAYEDTKNGLNDFRLSKYDTNSSLRKSIDIMRDVLEKIADKKQLILVVDELDRCLPAYQIKILERIHHLMDGQSNIIIYAINPEQLRKTIEQIYGGNSEERTNAYLKKFMDFQVALPIGTMQNNLYERHQKHFLDFQCIPVGEKFDEVIDTISRMFSECDARTINKIWEKQYLLHHMVCEHLEDEKKYSYIVLCVELMVLVMLQWRKKVSNAGSATLINGEMKVSPELLVHSFGFYPVDKGAKSIKEIHGLWQLWTEVGTSLSYDAIGYNKEGACTIVHLPSRELSLMESIGIYWCNASNHKFLRYAMNVTVPWGKISNHYEDTFNENSSLIGKFYKLACIID